jgi:ATP-dependent Clp protease ATP-binding subunit ClpC
MSSSGDFAKIDTKMDYIIWYYTGGLARFVSIWKDLLIFFPRYFAVGWHIRTLFSPWKRDISRVGRPGFHPLLWAQNAALNAITRFLGAIVRSAVILAGVLIEIAAVALGFLLILEWFFWPLFLFFAVFALFYFSSLSLSIVLLLIFVLSLLWVFYFSLQLYIEKKRNYAQMDLVELASQDWFEKVWERAGKMPSQSTLEHLSAPELLERFLESCGLTSKEFEEIISFELASQIEKENRNRWWLKENLYSQMPVGKGWTYAYTVHLDKYSADLSESDPTEYKSARLVGHDQDLSMLELVLSRPSQNNALVVGEAGVGKHTLVHTLAKKIRENSASPVLYNKRILEVKLGEIISSGAEQFNASNVLREIFFEAAYAGNVILVIDDIDRFLKASPQNPQEDISAVLLEFLNYPTFQVIGITTPEKFHNEIEKNERVVKFFEKVQIGEIEKEKVPAVLFGKLKEIEGGRVIFTYPALKEVVNLSDRYLTEAPFPEKALDLLEEVFLFWSRSPKRETITPEVVDEVISQKVHVPVGEMNEDEKGKLMHLEETLHRRLIGQDLAVKQIAETMRRARVGMASDKKPIGSFLFLGPTGVGKTESAKALAEAYFRDENRMTRLDMSEYQKIDSIDRLIGSLETGKPGILENKVRENPYALLLLDEIEKAHPDILNLFLQVLDEGWLTDAFGKRINFKNQIIIATSNAGSEIIKESVEAGTEPADIQKKITDYVIKEGIFRAELLNRFEGVIFFHPLSQEDLVKVTELILERYANRLKKEKNIGITFDPEVVIRVVQEAYDPVFGARAIHRYVEDKIGDNIVKNIISGGIKEGASFVFRAQDLT